MTLQPGARLGVYEVHSAIGSGGMGEVYRARDTRLQREVALKILPEAFSSDAERLARFDREARVLASLNHPNIAAIHGLEESDGVRALVLELVEGDTLADLIARRAGLPLDERISIARQIADALEAAHEQGVVHRDLKPSNVKVRPDGTVKVLDFGLAKLVGAGNSSDVRHHGDVTHSPTITTPAMTELGVIMGTAAYMSPEQAKGLEADKRSDVWSFGVLLYEMLSGRRAFDGDDTSETLASVLKIDPDWSRLPADTPPALRTLMQSCLVRDRRERVSDIAAAKFVLSKLADVRPAHASTVVAASRSHTRLLVAVGATALLTAAIVGWTAWTLRQDLPAPIVGRFSFTLLEGQVFTGTARQSIAVSADGTQIAYTMNSRLYLRAIGDLEPREAASGGAVPMFSPDSKSLAYFRSTTGTGGGVTVMRAPIAGGAAKPLATLTDASSGSWGPNGLLIGQGADGIVRVPASGGAPERIVTMATDEEAHAPWMLPDGRNLLFTVIKRTGADRWDRARIVVHSLQDDTRRELLEGSDARYAPTGHLLYAQAGTLFAVRFDLDTLTVKGEPVPVLVGVRRAITGVAHNAAISETGTMVYRPGPTAAAAAMRTLIVGDGRSDPQPLKIRAASYDHPRVSKDGKRLVVARTDGDVSDIWIYELSGASAERKLTLDGKSRFPIWSADGRFVTFQSALEGDNAIWRVPAVGGTPERLTTPSQGEDHIPESWSRDGHLLFTVMKGQKYSLWVLQGTRTSPVGKVESALPLGATFSPDGRWFAYAFADRTGGIQTPNRGVYVEPFPPTGMKVPAPKMTLDYHPVWAPDGKSIFYLPGASRPVISVPITTGGSVEFGKPSIQAFSPGQLDSEGRGYDLLPDGRFVTVLSASTGSSGGQGNEIRIVLNWHEELKRLVP